MLAEQLGRHPAPGRITSGLVRNRRVPVSRTDLGAILDRHSDAETGDIRRVLGARS